MKSFIVKRYAKANAVRAAESPEPTLGPDEVLVQVRAAGVNKLDCKVATGEFKLLLPYKLPFILGHDVAGVVIAVGPEVRGFAVGDEVYARPRDFRIGAFAERISIKADDLALKPTNLTMAQAASLPLVALTAWQALVEIADVQPGQKVLIHAGSGGLGTIAIQLAKHLGATVVTTTSAGNAALATEIGADQVIDYRTTDFTDVPGDYDVVIDSLGPESVAKSLTVLKPGGVVIGLAGPPDPTFAREIGANRLVRAAIWTMSRSTRAKARSHGGRYVFLFMKASGSQLRELTTLFESGAIVPIVDRTFNFDDTLAALAYVDTDRAKGKVVVTLG